MNFIISKLKVLFTQSAPSLALLVTGITAVASFIRYINIRQDKTEA